MPVSAGWKAAPRASSVETRGNLVYHPRAMIALGLETSEAWGGAALWGEEGLLGEEMLREPMCHAEDLLSGVERLLKACGVRKEDLGLVSVNAGPGSFTGLRIGLATGKGICQALGIPLVGVDGTVAYRARLDAPLRVGVVIENRRDLVYARWFSGTKPIRGTEVLTAAELLARVAAERKATSFVGSGAERLRADLERVNAMRVAPRELNCPSPAWIARLGREGGARDELYTLEPTYVESMIARAKP